jgi:hypothetical protein
MEHPDTGPWLMLSWVEEHESSDQEYEQIHNNNQAF